MSKLANISKPIFTLSELRYLCCDKFFKRMEKAFRKFKRQFFYEMIVVGIMQWLFHLTGLVSKHVFKISGGTIEQYHDNVPLKIVPLTSNTCLQTNRFCWVRTPAQLESFQSQQRNRRATQLQSLLHISLTLNRDPISKLFNYVWTNQLPIC